MVDQFRTKGLSGRGEYSLIRTEKPSNQTSSWIIKLLLLRYLDNYPWASSAEWLLFFFYRLRNINKISNKIKYNRNCIMPWENTHNMCNFAGKQPEKNNASKKTQPPGGKKLSSFGEFPKICKTTSRETAVTSQQLSNEDGKNRSS